VTQRRPLVCFSWKTAPGGLAKGNADHSRRTLPGRILTEIAWPAAGASLDRKVQSPCRNADGLPRLTPCTSETLPLDYARS
jgi:hypothetical protein